MVPYPPRPLVICSLPFAALVAFFWYKRRRSLSRSDPGGTETIARSVDLLEGKELGDNTLADEATPSAVRAREPLKVEEEIARKVEGVVCDTESPLTPPEFEENSKVFFHSTGIEDLKGLEESDSEDTKSEKVEDAVEKVSFKLTESFQKLETSTVQDSPVEKDSIVEQHSVPFEEQSTVENLALRGKIFDVAGEKACLESDDTLHSDKEDSSTSSDTVENAENISSDTGLGGSQDLSVAEEECKMAQGQKTEEKNAVELEHKLASLGLDTAPPAQRTERDSANHSPAEVMLNSPAISTYSDAHSEVEKWLNQCDPMCSSKSIKVVVTCETTGAPDPTLHPPCIRTARPTPPVQPPVLSCAPKLPGSSDSGKGCSDVVTPPSRTPAGGSSVAGDQVPSIYEFVLPQLIVGRLIGRHGAFLQEIRAKTHTNVFIKRHPETNTLKICAIEGTQQDIDAALKMIRQKFPLRRFSDLTLERVTFVKNSCLPIDPENLQLNLVEGVNNDVIISSLISAGHFFLQMPMHMSYQSLYKLTCIMNSVYNTHESPSLPDPKPDVVCVAPTHGGWYRAQIVSVDKDTDSSEVKFLDYGGFLSVDNSSLRQIRGDFLLLPFQAVECVLANVIPAGGEEEWSEEAKLFVQQMTTQQVLQAQVYDYTEAGLPLVYLYYTQYFQSPSDATVLEAAVVLLNQELVTRGYAELIEDSPPDDEGQTLVPVVESSS